MPREKNIKIGSKNAAEILDKETNLVFVRTIKKMPSDASPTFQERAKNIPNPVATAILLPIFMFFYLGNFMHSYFFISLIVSLLVIWKHRTNIKRLLKGEESKINQN